MPLSATSAMPSGQPSSWQRNSRFVLRLYFITCVQTRSQGAFICRAKRENVDETVVRFGLHETSFHCDEGLHLLSLSENTAVRFCHRFVSYLPGALVLDTFLCDEQNDVFGETSHVRDVVVARVDRVRHCEEQTRLKRQQ